MEGAGDQFGEARARNGSGFWCTKLFYGRDPRLSHPVCSHLVLRTGFRYPVKEVDWEGTHFIGKIALDNMWLCKTVEATWHSQPLFVLLIKGLVCSVILEKQKETRNLDQITPFTDIIGFTFISTFHFTIMLTRLKVLCLCKATTYKMCLPL